MATPFEKDALVLNAFNNRISAPLGGVKRF